MMKGDMEGKFRNKYRIDSARMPGHDYRKPGYYFITICTKNRICHFGNVINGKMVLSNMGRIVADEWIRTFDIRSNVQLDEWVVMPNHVHMIIVINNVIGVPNVPVETHCNASLPPDDASQSYIPKTPTFSYHNAFGPQRNNIASIIRGFKGATTKRIHLETNTSYFAWQPRFYDRIIRDERALYAIRQYIIDNPQKWHRDRNNRGIFS